MCDAAGRTAAATHSRRAFVAGGAALGATALLGATARRAGAQTDVGAVEVAPGLSIRPRAAWAGTADVPSGLVPEDVRFLLVHHTAGDGEHTSAQVPEILRGYHAFHTGAEKGWPDIAYNFLVDREGGVWEGRAGSIVGPVRGDATGGNQGYSQLVCLIGDFTHVAPTAPAQDAAARTLAWLADRHRLDTGPGATASFTSLGSGRWPAGSEVVTATIAGHRDMSFTACPGDAYYPVVVDELPATVTALRALMAADVPATTTTATTEVRPGGGTDPDAGPASTVVRPVPTAPAIPAAAAPASDPGGSPGTRVWAPLAVVAAGAVGAAGVASRRRKEGPAAGRLGSVDARELRAEATADEAPDATPPPAGGVDAPELCGPGPEPCDAGRAVEPAPENGDRPTA